MKHKKADIVARRQLVKDGEAYEVLIERPRYRRKVQDFACRWSLVDDTGAVVLSLKMYGGDSIDALTHALLIIGIRLGPAFTLPGGTDSGFPVYERSDTPGKFGRWRLSVDDG